MIWLGFDFAITNVFFDNSILIGININIKSRDKSRQMTKTIVNDKFVIAILKSALVGNKIF